MHGFTFYFLSIMMLKVFILENLEGLVVVDNPKEIMI
jgi:hypothetical protein